VSRDAPVLVSLARQLLWRYAGHSALLFPPALEVSNAEIARLPLDLDLNGLQARAQRRQLTQHDRMAIPLPRWLGGALRPYLRAHTPYLRVRLNATSDVRRAPAVGRPKGRGWILVSSRSGEDLYGRPLNLVTYTFLFIVGEAPQPWPPSTLCARLLKSASVRHTEWWADMSRALGGRLRPFALALVATSECEPEFGVPALVASSLAALLVARLSVRLVLGPTSE